MSMRDLPAEASPAVPVVTTRRQFLMAQQNNSSVVKDGHDSEHTKFCRYELVCASGRPLSGEHVAITRRFTDFLVRLESIQQSHR